VAVLGVGIAVLAAALVGRGLAPATAVQASVAPVIPSATPDQRPVAVGDSPIELILPIGSIEVTSRTLEVAGRVHADLTAVTIRLEGRGQRAIRSIEVPTAIIVRAVDGGVESVRAFRASLDLPAARPNGEMTLEVRPAGGHWSLLHQRVRLRLTIGPLVGPPPEMHGEDGLLGGLPFGNALGGEPTR
jgi:hypothetical protein